MVGQVVVVGGFVVVDGSGGVVVLGAVVFVFAIGVVAEGGVNGVKIDPSGGTSSSGFGLRFSLFFSLLFW